jgi:hypothetical protein
MHCLRCGGVVGEARETVDYAGPGPYVVKLRDLRALKCSACGNNDVEVPERHELDLLIRVLSEEQPLATPHLVFEQGRWRVTRIGDANGIPDHGGERM